MDDRVGTVDDGRRVWPSVDITGAPYDRTNYGAEYFLDDRRFVILPHTFVAWDMVAALKEEVAHDDGNEIQRRSNVSRSSPNAAKSSDAG